MVLRARIIIGMPLDGLRVIALESRRATEMATLITKQGGVPFVAPSMREVPVEHNAEAFAFAEQLFNGGIEMVIFLTGVGARYLGKVIASRYPEERFAEALRSVTVVARGPKPAAVLREWNVPITINVPEPNTWRELLKAIEGRPEKRVAVQEYGRANDEMVDALRARGMEVIPVPIYQWELPEDTAPLREAVARITSGNADVVLFTTSIQVQHLLDVGEQEGVTHDQMRAALRKIVVASIGPTTTEALNDHGIHPDFEPQHPKMGIFLNELSAQAAALVARKRS